MADWTVQVGRRARKAEGTVRDRVHARVASGDGEDELERLRLALAAAGDVVYDWDLATDIIRWSANAAQVFGLSDAAEIATRAAFARRVSSEDLSELPRLQGGNLASGTPFAAEYRVRRGDGEFCWVEDRGLAHLVSAGNPRRVVGTMRVITTRKQREARLERLVSYDELTGHYNRRRLRDTLEHALAFALRYRTQGAYLTVAVDDLSVLTEAYGQEAADAVLLAAGRELDRCLRVSDVVGRAAYDRFGIILNGSPMVDLEATAEKILASLGRATVATEGGPVHIGATAGGVKFPGTVRTARDTMAKADIALDQARRAGGGRFVVYDLNTAQRRDLRRHIAVAKRLQNALKHDRLRLAFQPVVDSARHKVAYYECLVRMRDERGRLTVAADFLPVAEKMGLVRQVDRRVLELVAEELNASPEVSLALNVSGLTTSDPQWLRALTSLVKARPELARRLVIEITETAALQDMGESVRFVAALKDLGCRIALDDFGAGYTSFRHLKALPVDLVKIDGSFVTNLAHDPGDRLFIETLQGLADGYGLATVAECVQSASVARILADQGVHYLQGYYFGRPMLSRPWRDRRKRGVPQGYGRAGTNVARARR